jgi:protein ImuB
VTVAPVGVSGRGEPTAAPARLRLDGDWRTVVAWAGPWPADEHWWDATGRRRARFQLLCEDGDALLASLEQEPLAPGGPL